jgi:hypothetical protein
MKGWSTPLARSSQTSFGWRTGHDGQENGANEMKRKISEFSYGFALTHELVNSYGFLLADAPSFPSLLEEGKAGGGYDVSLPLRGYPVFLQFKLSDYMHRRSAKESSLVGIPYFRFSLHRKNHSNQHQLLIELEKKGNAVFYASPTFHEASNLNRAFFDRRMVSESIFVRPDDIGELPDNDQHRIVFTRRSDEVYLCSTPTKLANVIYGDRFPDFARKMNSIFEPKALDQHFFEHLTEVMIAIFSPNRRMFDELLRGQVEMDVVTFASYIAKTFFDCELLIVRA